MYIVYIYMYIYIYIHIYIYIYVYTDIIRYTFFWGGPVCLDSKTNNCDANEKWGKPGDPFYCSSVQVGCPPDMVVGCTPSIDLR